MSDAKIDPGEVLGGAATEKSDAAPPDTGGTWFGEERSPLDLKRDTARGAVASVLGQGANLVLRVGSMVIIARLVTPEQFGLVGMVSAFTGFLALFRDAGLSQATVQREVINQELTSTLFWINLAIGVVLAALTSIFAPMIAGFYGDPRLLWITVALGTGFVFSGASAQHRALLQRRMRFGTLTAIDIIAVLVSIVIGVWMALVGMGYWALVGMNVSLPAVGLAGMWWATRWRPGMPRRGNGVRSMLHYGGVITLNSLVVYVAYNVDKVLLGRFWGAQALGLYGRAYQLISLPTESLHSAIGAVMFPALSRVQDQPERLRSYFLAGYGLFLSVVMPITMTCGLLAEDIVAVLLGPKWSDAAPVFRLLAPTILAFAFINPMGYMMTATGRATRSLKIAFLIAPAVILGYVVGLPYGPNGVALGFSVAMLVLVVPVLHWSRHGTSISLGDLIRAVLPPLASTAVAAVAAIAVRHAIVDSSPFVRLLVLTTVIFLVHAAILLFVFAQKQMYLDLLRATGVWPFRRQLTAREPRPDQR